MTTPYPGNANWPANFAGCTLTGKYLDLAGQPVTGTITLSATPASLLDTAAALVITPAVITITLDVNGAFSVVVPATDDPDINPTGWTYSVVENFPGGRRYSIAAPSGGTVDLSVVSPVASANGTPIIRGPRGATGPVSTVNSIAPDAAGNVALPLPFAKSVNAIVPDATGNVVVPLPFIKTVNHTAPDAAGDVEIAAGLTPATMPAPSGPYLDRNPVGEFFVEWDGLTSTGAAMPAQFGRCEVQTADLVYSAPTLDSALDFSAVTTGTAVVAAGDTRLAGWVAYQTTLTETSGGVNASGGVAYLQGFLGAGPMGVLVNPGTGTNGVSTGFELFETKVAADVPTYYMVGSGLDTTTPSGVLIKYWRDPNAPGPSVGVVGFVRNGRVYQPDRVSVHGVNSVPQTVIVGQNSLRTFDSTGAPTGHQWFGGLYDSIGTQVAMIKAVSATNPWLAKLSHAVSTWTTGVYGPWSTLGSLASAGKITMRVIKGDAVRFQAFDLTDTPGTPGTDSGTIFQGQPPSWQNFLSPPSLSLAGPNTGNGGAALPAAPVGYAQIEIAGGTYDIPLYSGPTP